MSRTSIELNHITAPVPVAKSTTSLRRPSTINSFRPSFRSEDGLSMQQTLDITSKSQTGVIIACVTLITAISTLLNGAITVALPTLARELAIPPSLLLWPTSIQSLVTGCTLLICGSIADSVGSRLMYLTGSILQTGAILGCGLSRIGTQLIVFRGLGGIALSFCLPSAVSIITSSFTGKRRDMAFASMGGGQPVGFSIGLALGGVLTDTIGWRWAFHLAAILNAVIFSIALWGLPKSIDSPSGVSSWATKVEKLKHEIDWIGALIASASLAMLSYAFATITGNTADIKEAKTLATLVIAFALIPLFVFWVGRQERLGRPAIIPNSLWRNKVFTTICLGVFLTWGSFNALETMLTFFFQEVQGLSAIQTSLRFLPAPVAGVVANVAIGLLVHRVAANYLVLFGCGISVVAPLVMAFAKPQSSFWSTGFLANVFNPTGADSLFTISNLLITSSFPSKTQALAGGVFNTISQIGKAVGLALVAVIASTVTAKSHFTDKQSPEGLMTGYRATFWFCFATVIATIAISLWGLRGIGKVGHKRD